jgi:(p)ppGpp synthase/HD superfamily hydrolase
MPGNEIVLTLLEQAIAAATVSHHGQMDKVGQPYILHSLRVMLALQEKGELAMMVGVLHDVVEDTPTTLAEIEALFGIEVAEGVDAMTQKKGQETYKEYVRRVAKHPLWNAVKQEDVKDNMRPERRVSRPDLDGMMERYEWAMKELDRRQEATL